MNVLTVLRFFAHVLLCAVLAACAAPVARQPPPEIFQDAMFKPGTQRIRADEVFAMSPAMTQFISSEFTSLHRSKGRRQALIDALSTRSQLKLEYNSALTRNAAEAFEARSGNCLSLVIMTAAFARHLELPVRFRSVFVEDFWSRSGGLYFLSGHVNLSLGMPPDAINKVSTEIDLLTIDFLPPEQLRGQRAMGIDEATIISMYMNNRAAENLREGRIDEAYWWARESVIQDPRYLSGYNTLGVIYRRQGQSQAAERALRLVLEREPGNVQAMSNLVLVLGDQGRAAEAQALNLTLSELQPYPPYRYFDLGIEAMKAGDYAKARDWFNKEVARSAYSHEFHFWLSLANYALGDLSQARKHMALATENSSTPGDQQRYAAKLEWLNNVRRTVTR